MGTVKMWFSKYEFCETLLSYEWKVCEFSLPIIYRLTRWIVDFAFEKNSLP